MKNRLLCQSTNILMGIFQVLVTDLDSDLKNRAVNFSIENGDHLHMFDIEGSEGNIIVHTQLDRETVSIFSSTLVNTQTKGIKDYRFCNVQNSLLISHHFGKSITSIFS